MKVLAAQSAFFAARRPRKDSPHTTDAYRRDLAGITTLLCATLDRDAEDLEVDELTAHALRTAFGAFADNHAKSSVLRAWSTWNQFLTFCVSDNLLPGNPMGAVARPKTPPCPPSRCAVRTLPKYCCARSPTVRGEPGIHGPSVTSWSSLSAWSPGSARPRCAH
ncbi:hypothetical protein [Kribbella sp. NPDC023855]|uniref:hypothetical protein n=1 Tax=Kribbella sp. NPDC023855 TaxID=3154698 RepID=UPI0033CD65D6